MDSEAPGSTSRRHTSRLAVTTPPGRLECAERVFSFPLGLCLTHVTSNILFSSHVLNIYFCITKRLQQWL